MVFVSPKRPTFWGFMGVKIPERLVPLDVYLSTRPESKRIPNKSSPGAPARICEPEINFTSVPKPTPPLLARIASLLVRLELRNAVRVIPSPCTIQLWTADFVKSYAASLSLPGAPTTTVLPRMSTLEPHLALSRLVYDSLYEYLVTHFLP